MEMVEISKFENKPVFIGYDWQCNHIGWCYGFVKGSECYSLETDGEKIFVSMIPDKYLISLKNPPSLDNPEIKLRDLEKCLIHYISEVCQKGIDNLKSINGLPIEIVPPYRKE